MKEDRKIRPEWIPNAYNPDSSKVVNEGIKTTDGSQHSLLYSDKSALLKYRRGKIRKKR